MCVLILCLFNPFFFFFFSQEQEENKGATSWPEYYIDQLNSMAAVSMSFLKTFLCPLTFMNWSSFNNWLYILHWNWTLRIKRHGSPKDVNSVINYSPSCLYKHVRPSFIFGTQIKIFLMKSESFLTLHSKGLTTFKAEMVPRSSTK